MSVAEFEPLDVPDCLRCLESGSLGRVAVSVGAMPAIFPVIYQVVDDSVAFGATADTRLASATNGVVVAFEVDGVDEEREEGWSVLVVGTARQRRMPTSSALWRPTDGQPSHDVFIPIERISGRRGPISRAVVEAGIVRQRARAAIERSSDLIANSEALVGEARIGRDAMTREIASLREALASRTVISSAVGILMARAEVTSQEAFDTLRRTSQNANRKLRDVAAELVERHEGHIRAARDGDAGQL